MACIFSILKPNKYAKITSKPYCVYIVTLSLYYQEKKYSFWPAAAPAHTASRYIRSRRLRFVAGHSNYQNFTNIIDGHLLKMINYFRPKARLIREKKHRVKSKRGKE